MRAYGNAAEFLNADDWACDCLVVDQRMPGMSGMELIAKLRTLEVRTPAILLISQPNLSVAARAARAEVPIVEKPLFGNALLDRICEACGGSPNMSWPLISNRYRVRDKKAVCACVLASAISIAPAIP